MLTKLRRQLLTLKTNISTLISPPNPTITPLLASPSTSSFEDITPPPRPLTSSSKPRSRAFLRPRRKKTMPPLVEGESAPNGKPDLDECAIVESDDVLLRGRLTGVVDTARLPLEVRRVETEMRRPEETEVVRPSIEGRGDSGVGVEEVEGGGGEVDGEMRVGVKEELVRRPSARVERKIGFGQRKVFQSGELRGGFEPFAVKERGDE